MHKNMLLLNKHMAASDMTITRDELDARISETKMEFQESITQTVQSINGLTQQIAVLVSETRRDREDRRRMEDLQAEESKKINDITIRVNTLEVKQDGILSVILKIGIPVLLSAIAAAGWIT